MRNTSLIFSIATWMLIFTSCNKALDLRPQGSIDKVALSDANGIDLIVTNAYASLTQSLRGGTPANWSFGSIYGGDANKGSTPGDGPAAMIQIEFYNILSNNEWCLEKWNFNYQLIKNANHAMNFVNSAGDNVNADLKKKRKGELLFLRALGYFELRRFFKMVPYVDDVLEATDNNPKVKNDTDIYPKIEADLVEAIGLLPEVQDNVGRVNKWAAQALLCKVYMYENKFSAAAPLLKGIIDLGMNSRGVKYQLTPKYSDNFNIATENNSETVFAIQHSTDDPAGGNADPGMIGNQPYGSAGVIAGWGLFQPSFSLVNSFQVDAAGLPKLDGSYMNSVIPGCNVAGANGVTDIADKTMPVDPRLDHTVGRRGVPYYDWGMMKEDWVRDAANGGFFLPKKNVWRKTDVYYTSKLSALNTNLIRFADVLLWYAEALAETDKPADGRMYVNIVRARAANDLVMLNGQPAANYKVSEYPASYFDSKEKALKAIRFERKLEFGMEGTRFFDLQRWGYAVAKEELGYYILKEKEHLSKFAAVPAFSEYKMVFPIPETQILSMGNAEDGQPYLKQNPGY
ncbi:RagB/SusD family nutrient uptake outer membrane protein [Chitinophaga sp. MM2321]|uniref:RagB/SusD family nutrient uptake outer membrane protein n=1 Tax=Chitinophaga sp. MM2321 TaxID=3137178 RepID=UPI0032D59C38